MIEILEATYDNGESGVFDRPDSWKADQILSLIVKEAEGMKKTGWYKNCGYCPDCKNEEHECVCKGYNKALNDLINQVRGK